MRWASGCFPPAAPPSCWPTRACPSPRWREVTGFPEMLDGRVKTLHPKVHGGLLARRDLPEHMAALKAHGIDTIDLLVVNLYPFEATVAKAGCTLEDAIENIDIGGPAMVRSGGQELEGRGRADRRIPVPAGAGRTQDRRQALATRPGSPCRWPPSTASATTTRPSATTSRSSRKTASAALFPGADQRPLRQAAGPALRREPAPAGRVLSRPVSGARLAGDGAASCRARSSRTTTSPTPMRPGNASRASTRRPA